MSEQNLFSENYIEAFNNGAGASIVLNRNQNLGAILASERSVFYVQIILRMLYFRREHEIEPLNDEIYFAVKPAQESFSEEEYSVELFNRDIQQLFEWNTINRRIEKERLRGYKDIRRQKFRYSLTDETVSFITWLEECLHNDLEDKPVDSRNFLVDLAGRLKETARSLQRIEKNKYPDEDSKIQEAAGIIYNVGLLDELTFKISTQLGELNARLLSFLFANYKLDEAKNAIAELEFYTASYLKQIEKLRREIVDEIDIIVKDETSADNFNLCSELAMDYYSKLPFVNRKKLLNKPPVKTFESLNNFYKTAGKLDALCRRINDTAMKVWSKLSAYLRELERKNTRLEDIKMRINEIAQHNENACFDVFFFELLAPAQMVTDTNYWKEGFEKADPPLPRLLSEQKIKEPKHFFKPLHKNESKPVQSMEQFKLKKLKDWIETKHKFEEETLISNWDFNCFEDFEKIIELAGNGILNKGKKLEKIDLTLDVQGNNIEVELKKAQLQFKDMLLKKKK